MDTCRQQRGFTLTEILVAITIFTVIILASLAVYNQQNKVFKSGVESSEMQQNTRVGFDKLVNDLRMEGFDYDRDGIPAGAAADGTSYQEQPDEQIEYMGSTAITFRGNLNYATGTDSGRETAYESNGFPVVTTNNSEIVTYALRSADASKNTGSIVFFADVAKPRDAYQHSNGSTPKERQVTITNVDLTNANPPYTLFRFSLPDVNIPDNTTFGPATALKVVETPIATNIRSLNFTYYKDTNADPANIVAPVNGAGTYDSSNPTLAISERDTRASVQAVMVRLVGMNEAPDLTYTNPTDTVAPAFRQYTLQSLVIPRNVGSKGIKEESLNGPDKPTLVSGCYGACSVPYFTWTAPVKGNVDFYTIVYDTVANGAYSDGYVVGDPKTSPKSAFFPRAMLPGTTYFFKLLATNGYGSSISDDYIQLTPLAGTTPATPGNFIATPNAANTQATLSWDKPATFAGASPTLTCYAPPQNISGTVPANSIPAAENLLYRVYRFQSVSGGANANFQPPTQGQAVLSETNGTQPIAVSGKASIVELLPQCQDFYYRVQAIASACAFNNTYNSSGNKSQSESAWNPPLTSPALKVTLPDQGTSPSAPVNAVVTQASGCPAPGTLGPSQTCTLSVTFDKVTTDASGNPMPVDTYLVQRTTVKPTAGTTSTVQIVTGALASAGSTVTVNDANAPMTDALGQTLQYRYDTYAQNCGHSSAVKSVTYPAGCYLSAPSSITSTSTSGGTGDTSADPYGLQQFDTVTISQTGITGGTARIMAGGTSNTVALSGTNPATLSWPGASAGTIYQVDFQTQDSSGCKYTRTKYIQDVAGICAVPGVTVTSSVTQTSGSGTTSINPWLLQPGNTITVAGTNMKRLDVTITNLSTSPASVVATKNVSSSPFTYTWPTLSNATTYQVDLLATDANGCQTTVTRFVKQYCPTYGGGTPVITSSDATPGNTGLTTSTAWRLTSGSTITVTEAVALKKITYVITDLSSNPNPMQSGTITGTSGAATLTWPGNLTTSHIYQVDLAALDVNNCTSVTQTRYVSQFCPYKGGATVTPTIKAGVATSTLDGSTNTKAVPMVPNIDTITVTESTSLTKVYVDYINTGSGTVVSKNYTGVSGATTITFSNPVLVTNDTYKLQITLEDASGCRSVTPYIYYVKQKGCLLTGSESYQTSGSVSASLITISNPSSQAVKLNSFTIYSSQLTGTDKITSITLPSPTTSMTLNPTGGQPASGSTLVTGTVASGATNNTIPAGGTLVVTINYNFKNTGAHALSPLSDFCATYTTTASPVVTQSCNITAALGPETNNPNSCQ